ncbi:tyrosine-type recombinase/integrase [Lacinutrix iliipiscaria]|uniref:Tyrosine-type recombinase/integrase n=1 Tax=Lacinutrix iliipiscaria TaxID=1230532 RepID=A0ABW5WP01_9FLAO
MKTQPVNYDKMYNEARKMFFDNTDAYSIERKSEYLAYLLALESGLRVSDLLQQKYQNFSFNQKIEKYCFTTLIKKTKSEHTGVISNELYHYIQEYKDAVRVTHNRSSEYIFYNYRTNKTYTRQWLHKRIKMVAKKLKFKNIGVHSIRKASAIHVLDLTGSLSMAQYHLSHKRATTTDKYLGVTKASALEQLAKVF